MNESVDQGKSHSQVTVSTLFFDKRATQPRAKLTDLYTFLVELLDCPVKLNLAKQRFKFKKIMQLQRSLFDRIGGNRTFAAGARFQFASRKSRLSVWWECSNAASGGRWPKLVAQREADQANAIATILTGSILDLHFLYAIHVNNGFEIPRAHPWRRAGPFKINLRSGCGACHNTVLSGS